MLWPKKKAERDQLWSNCVTHRSKYIRLIVCKGKTSDEIVQMIQFLGRIWDCADKDLLGSEQVSTSCCLRSLPQYKSFKASEDNRCLVHWAADLSNELPKGWQGVYNKPQAVGHEDVARLDALKTMSHKDHFMYLTFDGRSKTWRQFLDANYTGSESLGRKELLISFMRYVPVVPRLWLTYIGRPNEACIPSRQVVFSSNTRETAFLHCSFPKTRMSVQNHGDDSILETSSHYSHFCGLKFPVSLPKMKPALKESILGKAQSEIPEKWPTGGIPLFWQESKSKDVYAKLYKSLSAGLVLDMEAGSGQAGLAAMAADCLYVGVCKDADHARWVANILDKQALALMVTSGHMLYNQTWKDSINDIFASDSCLLVVV